MRAGLAAPDAADNGKAERFIQTMLQDWAYTVPYGSSDSRNRQLPRWLQHYNQLARTALSAASTHLQAHAIGEQPPWITH